MPELARRHRPRRGRAALAWPRAPARRRSARKPRRSVDARRQAHAQVGIHRDAHAARAPLLPSSRASARRSGAGRTSITSCPARRRWRTQRCTVSATPLTLGRIGFGDEGDAHGVALRVNGPIGASKSFVGVLRVCVGASAAMRRGSGSAIAAPVLPDASTRAGARRRRRAPRHTGVAPAASAPPSTARRTPHRAGRTPRRSTMHRDQAECRRQRDRPALHERLDHITLELLHRQAHQRGVQRLRSPCVKASSTINAPAPKVPKNGTNSSTPAMMPSGTRQRHADRRQTRGGHHAHRSIAMPCASNQRDRPIPASPSARFARARWRYGSRCSTPRRYRPGSAAR